MFWGFKYIAVKVALAAFTIVFGVSLIKMLAWAAVILFVIAVVLVIQAIRTVVHAIKRVFT